MENNTISTSHCKDVQVNYFVLVGLKLHRNFTFKSSWMQNMELIQHQFIREIEK